MAIQERYALKNIFKTGIKPTQQNFADLFDSYWHMNDGVATESWTSTNFAAVSGNGNYIQNSPSGVQTANFRMLGSGTINNLTIGNTTLPYDTISSASASGLYVSAATDFVVSTPGGHIAFNPNNFVGIGTTTNNGARLIIDGGPVSLAATTSDYAFGSGFMHYRSDLDKVRVGTGGTYKNLTTEDWVQTHAIQANVNTPQAAGFYLTGNVSFINSYAGGINIKYGYEGNSFSWAWYHSLTPMGHFSGVNNGGSGTPGPSVYPAANSYINTRMSGQVPGDFFTNYVQPHNLGLRNSYTHIGYEAIGFTYNDYYLMEAGGFFAAVNEQGSGRGICYMIGSEHVVKNTNPSLSSLNMQMIGMRAIADLNISAGNAANGVLAAGYFKATNSGDAKVYAIRSDDSANYFKDGVETEQPTDNGAGVWKLGKVVSSAPDNGIYVIAEANNSRYVEVMIDGQLVQLLTANVSGLAT